MGYFRFFFTHSGFFTAVTYPMHKKITKNPLNYYFIKVKKFHSDSVKNECSRTKKTKFSLYFEFLISSEQNIIYIGLNLYYSTANQKNSYK